MTNWSIRILVGVLGAACACGAAIAKLPVPAPTPESEAAAAAAAAKAAWSSKVAAFKMCQAQDQAVAHYMASAQAAGKEVKPATPVPACVDPGPFAEPAKPIEAAGAHSPTETAVAPPSTKQPDAEVNPARKP